MSGKQHILDSIRAIARRLGRAPTHAEFFSCARNSKYAVSRFFPKWNDAVRAAGLKPRKPGRQLQVEDNKLLRDWGETVRKKRALPSRRAYLLEGKYDPRTMEKRFGGWSSVPLAFRKFAKGKREWADVVALLPAPVARASVSKDARSRPNEGSPSSITPKPLQHPPLKGRATYGNPT